MFKKLVNGTELEEVTLSLSSSILTGSSCRRWGVEPGRGTMLCNVWEWKCHFIQLFEKDFTEETDFFWNVRIEYMATQNNTTTAFKSSQ